MPDKVKRIPDEYRTATPYLIVQGAAAALDFYQKAFGATELVRMAQPDGRIGHAEVRIGEARIMLADEVPEMGYLGPKSLGGSPVNLMLYFEDVDAAVARAAAAGAKITRPLQDLFYGDRNAVLEDPFGHRWTFATHKEDVTPEEMKKRMAAMSKGK
jgi:PhnB protein